MKVATPVHSMSPPTFSWQWLYALPILLAIALVAFITIRPVQVLPRITLAPGYSLIAQDGTRLTNEDMRGKITLYNFTYSQCQAPCPQTSQVMQMVQDRLGEVESGEIPLQLVTISVDPERDTPEILQAYAESLNAEPDRWHFASGPVDRLKWIIGGGFGIYFDHREDHSIKLDPAFALVDGVGILRAEYRTAAPEVDRILRDMSLIVKEAQNAKGATRYAYEAAHLFLCYPR